MSTIRINPARALIAATRQAATVLAAELAVQAFAEERLTALAAQIAAVRQKTQEMFDEFGVAAAQQVAETNAELAELSGENKDEKPQPKPAEATNPAPEPSVQKDEKPAASTHLPVLAVPYVADAPVSEEQQRIAAVLAEAAAMRGEETPVADEVRAWRDRAGSPPPTADEDAKEEAALGEVLGVPAASENGATTKAPKRKGPHGRR